MKVSLSVCFTVAAKAAENIGMLQVTKVAHNVIGSAAMDGSSALQVVEQRVKSLVSAVPDSEAHVDELDTILGLLNGFGETITESNAADESTLTTAKAAVAQCTTDFSANTQTDANAWAQDTTGATHESCRATEKEKHSDMTTKVDDLANFITNLQTPSVAFGCAVATREGNDRSQWFDAMEGYVTAHKSEWAEKELAASTAEAAFAAQSTSCNQAQTAYEQAFCSHRGQVDTTCGVYDECRGVAEQYYADEVTNAETRAGIRQTEHVTIERIRCYVNHLKSNSSATADCDANVDYSHLVLAIPDLDARADCNPVTGFPGTTEFSYGSLTGSAFTSPPGSCEALPTWSHLVTTTKPWTPLLMNVMSCATSGGSCDGGPFGECAGDCDGDSECEGQLECFQRGDISSGNMGEAGSAVPGCTNTDESGPGGHKATWDFCYDPRKA